MEIFLHILLGLMGAVLGSFAVAQVWRLRASQLQDEIESGEKVDETEWKKLQSLVSVKKKDDRSHCLNCGYQLKWYDLIPVFSWLLLGGKCRKCYAKIGWTEFIGELSMLGLFEVLFVVFNPFDYFGVSYLGLFRLIILLISLVPLMILFIYDMRWSLLPVRTLWIFNILAFIYWSSGFLNTGFELQSFFNILISMSIFPLIYFILAKISKEQWVGGGDWILAIGLVLLIPNVPIFTMLMLFLSNFIGLLFASAQSISEFKKIKKRTQIPFGPSMIIAMLILLIFQNFVILFM